MEIDRKIHFFCFQLNQENSDPDTEISELVRSGQSEVDLAPTILVADAISLGQRHPTQSISEGI